MSIGWMVVVMLVSAFVSINSYANGLKIITLKHRDAIEVQEAIKPLLPDNSAISIDNNRVIIRAPAQLMKGLVATVKAMDKPQKKLKVSIFRGKYPDKKGVYFSTTDTAINQIQTISSEEGQTIVATEKGLLKVVVADAQYMNNSDVVDDPNAALVERSATQIVANNGELEIVDSTNTESSLGELSLDTEGKPLKGELASSQRYELVDVPTGMHLRITLVGKKQARVAAKVVSAVSNKDNHEQASTELIALSSTVETMTLLPINQWTVISEKNTFSHRPALGEQRKVYSTNTVDDNEQSIWLKVEVL